jgi:hypothetical protein
MTVPVYNVRDLFGGNGVNTKFPYSFVIKEEIHLFVTMWDQWGDMYELTEGVDYTVYGMDDDVERYIIYPITGDPLPRGGKILLELDLPITQLISYLDNIFDADKHEYSFDYLTQMKAQQQSQIDRVQKVSIINDVFKVLNENDMGGLLPDHFNPPSQSSVNIFTQNKIDDTDLVDLMSDDVAPTQRADKVYADSRIDPDPDLTAESSVIAPSQKAALTKMKPYLTLPDKDYTYLVFDFLATAVGGAHYFKVFSLDVTRPEYAAFKDRFTKAPTGGWCMPWDLYDDGEGGLWPLTVVYDESQSSANEFVFVASRLDGGTIFGTIGNMAIYMKE